jgi:hypothetical protein
MNMPAEHGHLLGDIPALILVAVVLAVLMPRGTPAQSEKHPDMGHRLANHGWPLPCRQANAFCE